MCTSGCAGRNDAYLQLCPKCCLFSVLGAVVTDLLTGRQIFCVCQCTRRCALFVLFCFLRRASERELGLCFTEDYHPASLPLMIVQRHVETERERSQELQKAKETAGRLRSEVAVLHRNQSLRDAAFTEAARVLRARFCVVVHRLEETQLQLQHVTKANHDLVNKLATAESIVATRNETISRMRAENKSLSKQDMKLEHLN